jgi:hypothetical protein
MGDFSEKLALFLPSKRSPILRTNSPFLLPRGPFSLTGPRLFSGILGGLLGAGQPHFGPHGRLEILLPVHFDLAPSTEGDQNIGVFVRSTNSILFKKPSDAPRDR